MIDDKLRRTDSPEDEKVDELVDGVTDIDVGSPDPETSASETAFEMIDEQWTAYQARSTFDVVIKNIVAYPNRHGVVFSALDWNCGRVLWQPTSARWPKNYTRGHRHK